MYASTNENIDGEYVILSRKEEPFGLQLSGNLRR